MVYNNQLSSNLFFLFLKLNIIFLINPTFSTSCIVTFYRFGHYILFAFRFDIFFVLNRSLILVFVFFNLRLQLNLSMGVIGLSNLIVEVCLIMIFTDVGFFK